MKTRVTTLDLPSFNRASIGFDRLFNELERTFANTQTNSYPPYNVVQINEDEYLVSLAVAGFSMDDLAITQEHNILRIEGACPPQAAEVNYLHKGIAGRSFRREFTLADHVEVKSATLELGMLNIRLYREIPEKLQPKTIDIVEIK